METEVRTIADREVRVTPFPARKGSRLRNQLVKILGPGIGALRAFAVEGEIDQLMPALGQMLASADPDELEHFTAAMLSRTVVIHDGTKYELSTPPKIDQAFGADVLALDKALMFALEVNFRGFFIVAWSWVLGLLSRPGKASESSSPETSPTSGQPGSSG